MRGFSAVEVCSCAIGNLVCFVERVARHSEARIVGCASGGEVLEDAKRR